MHTFILPEQVIYNNRTPAFGPGGGSRQVRGNPWHGQGTTGTSSQRPSHRTVVHTVHTAGSPVASTPAPDSIVAYNAAMVDVSQIAM